MRKIAIKNPKTDTIILFNCIEDIIYRYGVDEFYYKSENTRCDISKKYLNKKDNKKYYRICFPERNNIYEYFRDNYSILHTDNSMTIYVQSKNIAKQLSDFTSYMICGDTYTLTHGTYYVFDKNNITMKQPDFIYANINGYVDEYIIYDEFNSELMESIVSNNAMGITIYKYKQEGDDKYIIEYRQSNTQIPPQYSFIPIESAIYFTAKFGNDELLRKYFPDEVSDIGNDIKPCLITEEYYDENGKCTVPYYKLIGTENLIFIDSNKNDNIFEYKYETLYKTKHDDYILVTHNIYMKDYIYNLVDSDYKLLHL